LRRRVEIDRAEVELRDGVAAVDGELRLAAAADRPVADVVDVDPVGAGERSVGQLEPRRLLGDDRARAVRRDEDRALRHPARNGNGLVDVLELVVDDADEADGDPQPPDRHGCGRGGPAACAHACRREDVTVGFGGVRHSEDGVTGGEADADDHARRTVTISCGRYGTTIEPSSTARASPPSSSAFVRSARSKGAATRTRALPRPPCASYSRRTSASESSARLIVSSTRFASSHRANDSTPAVRRSGALKRAAWATTPASRQPPAWG